VAIDGRVEARPILPITATIDHRYAAERLAVDVTEAALERVVALAKDVHVLGCR